MELLDIVAMALVPLAIAASVWGGRRGGTSFWVIIAVCVVIYPVNVFLLDVLGHNGSAGYDWVARVFYISLALTVAGAIGPAVTRRFRGRRTRKKNPSAHHPDTEPDTADTVTEST